MKRHVLWILLFAFVILVGVGVSSAAPTAADTTPTITSFTSLLNRVDRAALASRSARVPVSWTTLNRPIYANLVFEQVLPDGSTINVELPRIIPWVNSAGDGVAAPILPVPETAPVVLRVRLMNLLTNQVMSEKQLSLTVSTDGSGSGTVSHPAITRFVTPVVSVRPDQLANHTARIPVSWTAVNRPVTANLVFEQILADGSIVNVELPRDNPFVGSAGDGVAAPVPPGGSTNTVQLRVRLIDLWTGRVYDQREIPVAVSDSASTSPKIRFFTTPYASVDPMALAQRTARVPVSWAVDNRPDNSNLVFEQVLDNGSVINVELPRPIAWVSSSGDGVANPALPQTAANVLLRVRLVNLSNNTTIDTRELVLPINGRTVLSAQAQGVLMPTPTSTAPVEVVSFAADAEKVVPGETVTINWEARNAQTVTVRLGLTTPDARDVVAEALPLAGTVVLDIPATIPMGTSGLIYLDLYNGSNTPTVTQTLPLSVVCPSNFFYGQSNDCVTGDPMTVSAAFQTFEHGAMVWESDTKEMFALFDDGTGMHLADSWDGTPYSFDQAQPEGLYLPTNGFGNAWLNHDDLRAKLGFATGPEQSYSGQFQRGAAGMGEAAQVPLMYFSLPDGRVVKFTFLTLQDLWNTVA